DTPDVPTTAPAPVADYVAANRGPVAVALIAVGLVCLAVGGYYLVKGFNAAKPEVKADAPDAAPDVVIANPNQTAYLSAGIIGLLGAAVGIGVGGLVLAKVPRPDVADRRADARGTILLAGGLFGFVLMLGGLWFFYLWFGSLTAWLDQGKRGEAKWVLGPILAFVAGAALAFAASQPARAEERNNPLLRRLVYGSNLGLSALLLLLLLTAGNVFAALRVPNQLDTTSGGVYTLTLHDSTRQLIAGLDQPVTAYSTLYEGAGRDAEMIRVVEDSRRLLTAAQEVDPAKFRVRFLNPSLDKDEIDRLSNTYPQFDRQQLGILLVAGEGGAAARASFIRGSELSSQESDGRSSHMVFQGEARLARELLFLSEGKTRPVVYFTQGHGELEIAPPPAVDQVRPAGVRTATAIREAMAKNNVDVRPLTFDLTAPKVPDDATVLVVADPTATLPKEQAEAIAKYMAEPRPGGKKKGKLIVLTSPHPRPTDNMGVIGTGLEDMLLNTFGVQLGQEYLYNEPLQGVTYNEAITALSATLVQSRNPLALAFLRRPLVMPDCRKVMPAGPARGPRRVEPLFVTVPDRFTWLETDPLINPTRRWRELLRPENKQLRGERELTGDPRVLSVLVSEMPADASAGEAAPTARVAVYGSGTFFADPPPARRPNQPADLFVATLDWLRDRPVVTIPDKAYGRYEMKPGADATRLLYLPVGLTVLGILAVGFGMWVFRQK
ncbi:MAG TPA: Gldg family protein, partial [Fimbriiglobus sp.]|nr:Gldg family protein [Fimbriiglobus sp.]